MSSGQCGTLKVFVTHLYAVVVRGWSRGTECTAGYARAEVIVYFFFFYTFVLSLSCLWAFTVYVIDEIRMYGWRAFSWPFISHTLAVKK